MYDYLVWGRALPEAITRNRQGMRGTTIRFDHITQAAAERARNQCSYYDYRAAHRRRVAGLHYKLYKPILARLTCTHTHATRMHAYMLRRRDLGSEAPWGPWESAAPSARPSAEADVCSAAAAAVFVRARLV
jgi:hypothetical protein